MSSQWEWSRSQCTRCAPRSSCVPETTDSQNGRERASKPGLVRQLPIAKVAPPHGARVRTKEEVVFFSQQYLALHLAAIVMSLALLLAAWRAPRLGRLFYAILFGWA